MTARLTVQPCPACHVGPGVETDPEDHLDNCDSGYDLTVIHTGPLPDTDADVVWCDPCDDCDWCGFTGGPRPLDKDDPVECVVRCKDWDTCDNPDAHDGTQGHYRTVGYATVESIGISGITPSPTYKITLTDWEPT